MGVREFYADSVDSFAHGFRPTEEYSNLGVWVALLKAREYLVELRASIVGGRSEASKRIFIAFFVIQHQVLQLVRFQLSCQVNMDFNEIFDILFLNCLQ